MLQAWIRSSTEYKKQSVYYGYLVLFSLGGCCETATWLWSPKLPHCKKNCNKNLKQRGARLWTVWELLLQSEHIGDIHRVSGPLTMIMCATCSTSWTSVMLVIIVKVVWGYLADNKDWRWGVREQLVWYLRIVWRWIPSGNNEISGGLILFITPHWLSWITSVS